MTHRMPDLAPVRPGAIAFWMLNDASTVAEKIEYLRACHAGGIEALAMHPRSGNLTPYASKGWYDMIAALVTEGRRLKMNLWLYDEDPYPSGAAGGLVMAWRPELKARYLVRDLAPARLKPGDLWCIGEDPVLWAGLIPRRPGRPAHALTATVGMLRRDWFMTPWDSRYYYDLDQPVPCARGDAVRQWFALRVPEIPAGYDLAAVSAAYAGVEGSWGSLPDLLHPDAFDCFRALSLEPYRKAVGREFGRTIPGIFTDEAKPHGGLPITPDLWPSFRERYGIDLKARLYQLFGPALDQATEQLRIDYRRWVADRFIQTFVRPYRRWCDQMGLRLVGHFSPEDDPIAEAVTLVSAMPIMGWMSGPGTDVIVPRTGDRRNPTLNLGSVRAASVRAQRATGICISESLGLSRWDVTTQTCRRILAWQKVLGIDRFFIHGFYTSSEGVQNYEAPPEFGPGSSLFAGIGELNAWLKRIEQRLDHGRDVQPVALLNSMPTFWTGAPGTPSTPLLAARESLWRTLLHLLEAHAGVHLVDETDLAKARVGMGGLKVGQVVYRQVVAPAIDIVQATSLDRLQQAVEKGVAVTWFGGGPRRRLDDRGRLERCPRPAGMIRAAAVPSRDWCRRNLPVQATLSGPDAHRIFVRRIRTNDQTEYLLAANIEDTDARVVLRDDHGQGWQADEIDGSTDRRSNGIAWRLPAGGCGLFRRVAADRILREPESVPVAGIPLRRHGLQFTRETPNIARLTRMTVRRKGRRPLTVPFPRPYWQLFDDYRADRVYPSYAGAIPIESRTAVAEMVCQFEFSVVEALTTPVVLVLDPRCARGRFDLALNGKPVRCDRVFPLDRIQPLRVPLRRLPAGRHAVSLRFKLETAMDGVLSQLYLEGDFYASVAGGRPRLARSGSMARLLTDGWQRAGMPHYMGQGTYRWTERIPATEAASNHGWRLELERVTDSADLWVDGQRVGRRAWAPWHWDLPALSAGEHRFELRVHGTAGNLHELECPNQPQGWIGSGRLVAAPAR